MASNRGHPCIIKPWALLNACCDKSGSRNEGHLTATVSASWPHSPPFIIKRKKKTWIAFIKRISPAIVQLIISSPTISGCDKIRQGILIPYHLISNYENVWMGRRASREETEINLQRFHFVYCLEKKTVIFHVICLKSYQNQVNLVALISKRYHLVPSPGVFECSLFARCKCSILISRQIPRLTDASSWISLAELRMQKHHVN